jgi:hypothetical protein
MCDIIVEDVNGACEPLGGVAVDIYYAKRSDFETVIDPPALSAEDVTYESLAKIATAHTFKAGKKFKKIKITSKTGSIKSTQSGTGKNKMFTSELTGRIEGSEAKVLGFQRAVKNGDFVVLAVEVGSGRARQLGSDRFSAEFSASEHLIEALPDGQNALTFTIQDMQPWPAPIYTGVIAYDEPAEPEE